MNWLDWIMFDALKITAFVALFWTLYYWCTLMKRRIKELNRVR